MSNVIQFPGSHIEADYGPEPEPIVIRIVIPEPEPAPAVTPIGIVFAILCAIGSFAIVSSIL